MKNNLLTSIKNAAIGEELTSRLRDEQRQLLLQRARVLCWLGPVVYLFTILTYNFFYYPQAILGGLVASVPPSIGLIILSFTLDHRFIQRHYNLPLFLILGFFSNYAETVNLQLTGGGGGLFLFPYFLIYFTMAVYYPGHFAWVMATSIALISAYMGSEMLAGEDLSSPQVATNIIYLTDVAVIAVIGNRVIYHLFVREKKQQMKLEEANEALEQANEQLQSLDKAKTRFFSNITHEFRTPLVALSSTIQMIADQGLKNPEEQKRLLLSGKESIDDMLDNVNDLLLKTRSEKGMVEMKWAELDFPAFVERALKPFETVAKNRRDQLVFRNCVSPHSSSFQGIHDDTFYADRAKLKKIINNLVGNAIKFTENGTIEITVDKDDSHYILRVKDTGQGIPEEDLPTIFDPFTQAGNNLLREAQGTGLGLAIVKDFVEKHGGQARVTSTLGEGSTFTVTFLLGDRHIDKDKIDTSEILDENESHRPLNLGIKSFEDLDPVLFQGDHPEKVTVLIVEDNPKIIQILAYVLKDHYNLRYAKNGKEGLEKTRDLKPTLIISDVMMPQMNGYELVRAIKADPDLRLTPVILLTSKADVESKIRGLEEGADEYLSKPFNNQEVLTRVRTLLDKRKMEIEFIQAEKMISMGHLVAGVAHEINNPLSAIIGSSDTLSKVFQKLNDHSLLFEKAQEYMKEAIEDIGSAVKRAHHVTQLLKGFVRQGTKGFTPDDIHNGLDATIELVSLENKQLTIDFHRTYDLKDKVVCNINSLNQVFFNLLQNAAHAIAKQENRTVWIHTYRDDGHAYISIRDEGPGIPKGLENRIFDRFFTTKDALNGTGQGLHISREIVREHGGTLSVKSAPGQGAEFLVTIPFHREGGQDESTKIADASDRGVEAVQYPYRR